MIDELIKNWVDDILNPDIDWSEVHEQLGEYLDDWDEIPDPERDHLANQVLDGINLSLSLAHAALVNAGRL